MSLKQMGHADASAHGLVFDAQAAAARPWLHVFAPEVAIADDEWDDWDIPELGIYFGRDPAVNSYLAKCACEATIGLDLVPHATIDAAHSLSAPASLALLVKRQTTSTSVESS